MALTLVSGSYVKFQYNLGTGPIDIINWAVRVRPGYWYTAYATRSVECYLLCAFYVTSQQPYLVFPNNAISLLSAWEISSLMITQKFSKHLHMLKKKRVIVLNN